MNIQFEKRNKCPICNSLESIEIFSIPYSHEVMRRYLADSYEIDLEEFELISEGIPYQVQKCCSCGSLFQLFQPNLNLLLKIYDQYINSDESLKRKKFPSNDTLWLYSGEMSLLSSLINKGVADTKLLDYACGWGIWAKVAKGWGYDVSTLELSQSRSRHLQLAGITVINSLIDKIEYFDFINCDQVFEHLCNPIVNLTEINKSLKSGGVVKISIPYSPVSWLSTWSLARFGKGKGTLPDIMAPLEHLNYCNRKGLRILAEHAGFEVINISLFDYFLHFKIIGSSFSTTIKNIARPFYRYFFANVIFLRKNNNPIKQVQSN